jgi:hypothetical protein
MVVIVLRLGIVKENDLLGVDGTKVAREDADAVSGGSGSNHLIAAAPTTAAITAPAAPINAAVIALSRSTAAPPGPGMLAREDAKLCLIDDVIATCGDGATHVGGFDVTSAMSAVELTDGAAADHCLQAIRAELLSN